MWCWACSTTTSFTTPRISHTSVVYNGHLYVIGGFTSAAQNDVQYAPVATVANSARYERTIDTGSSGNILSSFTINGSTACSYTLIYKTAGSNGIYGAVTTLLNVYPGITQTLAGTQRYMTFAATLDDSTCGGQSTITDIGLTYNGAPDAPTLVLPSAAATGVAILPEFRLGSTDDSNDYLRYQIQVCTTSNCSVVLRTIDQTLSQVGWLSQGAQAGTAYTGGLPLTQYAVHTYQPTALTASTQYWWRGYAIDPGGSNQLSAASVISTFTTGVATPSTVNIRGGTTIKGGTNLR